MIFILVSGPDGSGKSTIVENVVNRFQTEKEIQVVHRHFRIWEKTDEYQMASKSEQVSIPHWNYFLQISAICYRFLNYILFFFKNRNAAIIIQERGWIDQFVSPDRYRLDNRTSNFVLKLTSLLPKPELFVILGGDAKSIWQRKKEYSILETESTIIKLNQLKVYVNVANLDSVVTSVEDCSNDLFNLVIQEFALKCAQSLRVVRPSPSRMNLIGTWNSILLAKCLYRPLKMRGIFARVILFPSNKLPLSRRALYEYALRSLADIGFLPNSIAFMNSSTPNRLNFIFKINSSEKYFAKFSVGEDNGILNEYHFLQNLTDNLVFDIPIVEQFRNSHLGMILVTKFDERVKSKARQSVGIELILFELDKMNVTHGDFTVWNVAEGVKPLVFDWERARYGIEFGLDLATYLNSAQG